MTDTLIRPERMTENQDFLSAACNIGDHLLETALWDAEHETCNWLARRDIEDAEVAPYADQTAALSPEIYSGSGGLALFLAELFGLTQNPDYRASAVAAWLRSVRYMRTNEFPDSPLSFYAGKLGLLYVGYRILDMGQNADINIAAELDWLSAELEDALQKEHSLDVIGGNAGAIPALLYLAEKHDLEFCGQLAVDCAQEIVNKADWQGDMCLWTSEKIHGIELNLPPLTGYSHGAAGLGVALLEVYAATQNPSFLQHARGAFAFEAAYFNDAEGNWIDTRHPHKIENEKNITGTCRNAWCHGAPGIALAHMRAASLDTERQDFHRRMAKTAIETTKRDIAVKLKTPRKDATLCHGILGSVEIVLTYGKYLQDEAAIEFARSVTSAYLAKFNSPLEMASGLNTGSYSPSLMIGLAGIGMHCLRLIDDSVRSVLITLPDHV